MRFFRVTPGRARRPTKAAAWASLAVASSVLAVACGRIGYGLLPPDAKEHPTDASADRDTPRDATEEPLQDAIAAAVEAGDAPAVDDGGADAAPEGSPDDALDANTEAEAEAGCPDAAPSDYCTALPALASPPVIDGILDLSPCLLVDMVPEFWSGPSPLPPFPPGNATQIAAAWRPDGLYVFLAVTTPAAFPADAGDPVFYGAGVELFIDNDGVYTSPPSYDDPGTIQIVVTSPASATGPTQRAEEFRNAADEGPWASTQYATFATAAGFTFEGFVAAADLGLTTWPLALGSTVGFDVAIDVSFATASMTGPQGHRVGQYFFHVAPADAGIGSPFADPRAFCTPTLAQ
jgi:hypothetical protein